MHFDLLKMPEENQGKGKLSDRHWLYSLKMVILSAARKGSGPPGLGGRCVWGSDMEGLVIVKEIRLEIPIHILHGISKFGTSTKGR